MKQRYEYKFIRLGEKWWGGTASAEAQEDYQQVIHQHAQEGWRLVQVFTPALTSAGTAKYFEIIFEREHDSSST